MSYVSVQTDDAGVAWVSLHSPDSKVNTLGADMMFALDEVLGQVTEAKAVVFISDKPGQFIAGADINELLEIQTENEALAKAKMGQEIFNKISRLSMPTLAVINGPSMGGGTELALSCDWRIMTDNPKVVIALPEVRLGIIPGWGGTQRLPKLVGYAAAVDMIISGRSIRGKRCLKMGLVDQIISDAFWREQAEAFIHKKMKKPSVPKKRWRGFMNWFLSQTGLGRRMVGKKARQGIAAQGGAAYPAPTTALEVIEQTHGHDIDSGLESEAKAFANVSQTDVSGYLVKLFLLNEQAKRQFSDHKSDKIEHAGVVGAGIMGGGIAWLFSQKSINVRVKDIAWKALSKAFQTAASLYKGQVKKRRMKPHEMTTAMNRLSGGLDSVGMRHAQVVVEAVVENLSVKQEVLQDIEKNITDDCTLCSNTSSLLLKDMAEGLAHPERFVGMHFFNPVNKMPLVELVRGPQTSEEHLAKVTRLAIRLGKTPVVVNDGTGFVVNRLLMPYMNEAVYCAEDGAEMERIDQICKRFGMPMGPFLLADEVGLDVCYKVAHNLQDAFGERMEMAKLLAFMYKDKELLGKKAGKGFYVHKKKRALNKTAQKAQLKFKQDRELSDEDIRDRCLFVMVNEAARCLDEGIVASPGELDLAMIMGTGFPPYRGGLLQYADKVGLKHIIKRMHDFKYCGKRLEVAPALLAYSEAGGFYKAQG